MDQTEEHLSQKDLKKLKYQQKIEQINKEEKNKKLMLWSLIIMGVVGVGIAGWFLVQASNRPLPGQEVKDLGRNHVTDISSVKYNSNPPTSGPHFSIWAKKGMYNEVISDGYLIHSLEHGYVVISYNCDVANATKFVYSPNFSKMIMGGKDGMSTITPKDELPKIADLPKAFSSDGCKDLVKQVSQFLPNYDRVIIVPRPTLDVPVALTAWNRIEKFQTVDQEKMRIFIDAFHNQGPEKTIE